MDWILKSRNGFKPITAYMVIKRAISLDKSTVANIFRSHVTLQDSVSNCHPSVSFKQNKIHT